MKKYFVILILLLCILVPRTNSKYVLTGAKNLGVKTPGFDVVETTNGPILIKDYKKDFIEIKIKNNGKKDAKGEIVIEGVKLKDVNVAAGKEVTYKFFLTEALYNKLAECDIYPVKVNYLSPYKISKDVTTIKRDASTIHGKVKCMNLGSAKDKGIDYSKVNSSTNGEGVYLFDETKNDTNPVYFFRGTHQLKNNLLYANMCWKIVRTTGTGGVRVVYNGAPVNGKCTNTTGDSTQIGTSKFNPAYDKKKYVGYMFGDDANPYQNTNDSDIKKYIDNWYKTNIKDKGFESILDKGSIYCGDRTETKTGNDIDYMINAMNHKPSTRCPSNDSYGAEAGNRKLRYPVGLLTIDETILAGTNWSTGNNKDFYLYTSNWYLLLSPYRWRNPGDARVLAVCADGSLDRRYTATVEGVRPAVTLKGTLPVLGGDGSQNKPFVMTKDINSLYKKVKSQSLGNDRSLGIDYSRVNSYSNGQGVYLFDETKYDEYPVYFYRGTHSLNNNLLYAGFCWKIVRTTETGGVKAIYNGTPVNGRCTAITGKGINIGEVPFNHESRGNKKYVGYMYGTDYSPYQNIFDSKTKEVIDSWYRTNIQGKSFESKLDKKAIYCGDRTEVGSKSVEYKGRQVLTTNKPSMKCPVNDSYSVEGGNKALTYPIALLSVDEALMAGGQKGRTNNKDYYLFTNDYYWLLSPDACIDSNEAFVISVHRDGWMDGVVSIGDGVRPAITIANNVELLSGDGSQNNPYVV